MATTERPGGASPGFCAQGRSRRGVPRPTEAPSARARPRGATGRAAGPPGPPAPGLAYFALNVTVTGALAPETTTGFGVPELVKPVSEPIL